MGMRRHRIGNTSGNNTHGSGGAHIINEDDIGGNAAVVATNIEMNTVRREGTRKAKTTTTQPPQLTASTTSRYHARVARMGPSAMLQWCHASQAPVLGLSKKMHGKEEGSNDDNDDNNGNTTSNTSTGGQERAWGSDDTIDGARIHHCLILATRAVPAEKDIVTIAATQTHQSTSRPEGMVRGGGGGGLGPATTITPQ